MEPAKNQPPQPDASLHFLDYWRIIRIRKTIIISVFLLIAITATIVTFILPEQFSSMARIEINVDSTVIQNMTGGMSSSYLPYDPYFIQTEFEKMQSEKVLGRVVESLNLNEVWGKKYNGGAPLKTEDTLRQIKQRMVLATERNTKLVDITVYSDDKQDAAQLANAIAVAYQQYRLDLIESNTLSGIRELEKEFQAEQVHIQLVQSNVDNLRKELNIVDLDPNALAPTPSLSSEQVTAINTQKTAKEEEYVSLEKMAALLHSLQMTNAPMLRDVLPGLLQDPTLGDLLSKQNQTAQSLATLKVDYGTNNPDLLRLQKLSDELNREIEDRVAGIMLGLDTKVQSLGAAVDALTASVTNAIEKDRREAERGARYWEAKRDLANLIEIQKLRQTKIAAEKTDLGLPKTQMVNVVDWAKPGNSPVKPNKTVNIILGVVFGLLTGIGLAFFIEYLDTSVKTIDDVERALQAPVLGVIPQNVSLLTVEGAESQHAEAYRVLRTNLLFSRKDDRLNSIVVVSAGAGEGKSTTVLNLAIVFAQSGHRVLVVDSDLRRPTLHKALKVGNGAGLTSYLLKQNTLEEVIQRTSVPTLDFLASGKLPSSSMNILGSANMKELVSNLKRRYDYVFFDSPPIMGVSDAAVLASEMDMVIQVIQYRRYPQPMNIRAKQMIEKVGGNLIGIVLNNINISQDESYYYYSGYYHGYYYYSKNEEEQNAEAAEKPGGGGGEPGIKQQY